ncbi:MAG: BON domain-containing protein [Candidatus Omnitrophica bacterium]|nr:BON domain-containing protein [Candidatus Omnitrophota bacterium]
MHTKTSMFVMLVLAVSVLMIHPGNVQARSADVDNTKINERDRAPAELTADDQGQSSTDLDTTKRIRQAVVDDKSLSMNGHNVKIITKDGQVTLKGPVTNEQEKNAIAEIAASIAGVDKVRNELDVKSPITY